MAVRRFVLTPWTNDASARSPALALRGVTRAYGEKLALRECLASVAPGAIHALLGPNGAGKTTLIRILSGLLVADRAGRVRRRSGAASTTRARSGGPIGLVPVRRPLASTCASPGLENLVFFARLHGLGGARPSPRAHELLEHVGLADAAKRRVGFYSHGMQKRLVGRSCAPRRPADPARRRGDARSRPGGRAPRAGPRRRRWRREGAAVVWATQRLDEIRGFVRRRDAPRERQGCASADRFPS